MGSGNYTVAPPVPNSGSVSQRGGENTTGGVHSGDDTSRAVALRGRYTVKLRGGDGRTVRVKPENVKMAEEQAKPPKTKVKGGGKKGRGKK